MDTLLALGALGAVTSFPVPAGGALPLSTAPKAGWGAPALPAPGPASVRVASYLP